MSKDWDRTVTVCAIACDIPECGNAIKVTPASQPKYWQTFTVRRSDNKEAHTVDLCPECSAAILKIINDYRRPKSAKIDWSTEPWPQPQKVIGWSNESEGWK